MPSQADLFESDLPSGFVYKPDFVTRDEERRLVAEIRGIAFSKVEMRGGVARRRTAHYGWTYGYEARTSEPGAPIPEFLLPVRERAAHWAGIGAEELAEALITEYTPGAAIGWHRDAPMFGRVIAGISLLGACRMKLRPYVSPGDLRSGVAHTLRRATHQIELEPRSAYLITDVARRDYEHHIPPTKELRYSITFRTLKP